MKQIFSIFSILLLAATIITSSCKKEGPVGPAGPTGSTGPAGSNGTNGAAGPAGPAGPKGEAGTANVIYSDWLDVAFEKDSNNFFAQIDAGKIDLAMLSTGEIKVFINLQSADDPLISPLPYVEDSGVLIKYLAFNGGIEIDANVDASTFQDKNGKKNLQYRYILIPGGIAARQSVNWDNYEEVKVFLHLKD